MKTLLTVLVLLTHIHFFAQQKGFVAPTDIFGRRVFIENKGQFNKEVSTEHQVLFGYVNIDEKVFFTPNGLVYRLEKHYPLTHEQREELEHGKTPPDLKKSDIHFVTVSWEGANKDVKIEKAEKQSNYHSYGDAELKSDCFKKITYKNIYNNIDIEYLFTDDKTHGIKYNVILHAGANPNDIKIKYSGDVKEIAINNQNIVIKTPIRDIVEHNPISLQEGNKIQSVFTLVDGVIGFNFPNNYNRSKELIIDPWVTTLSSLTTNNYGFQVDYDNAGNYYVYGGGAPNLPFCVAKYSFSGTIQWTFNGVVPSQTWDTGNSGGFGSFSTPGNFIVEKSTGRFFMGNMSGFDYRVVRVNSSGIYDNFVSTAYSGLYEIWDFDFNCATGDLISFGCDLNFGSGGPLNTTTGIQTVNNINGDFSNATADIICVTKDVFGNTFALYAGLAPNPNKISRINSTYNGSLWHVSTSFSTIVELDNIKFTGNQVTAGSGQPLNGLAANGNYLYYYDGLHLAAYNKNTGGLLSSITIAGHTAKQQTGIAVDDCDNVYIGGNNNNILAYNFNGSSFSALSSISLGASTAVREVCDIKYNVANQSLYVSGTGFGGMYSAIHSINCNPPFNSLNVTSSGACSGSGGATANVSTTISSPLVSYTWYNSGGTIVSQTNNTTALSNAVTLSTGVYTVVTQINAPCGPMNSQTVNVSSGTPPTAGASSGGAVTCSNPNVTLTGTGGVSYSWSGPSIVSGAATANPVVNAGGTYNVLVTAANGCTATTNVVVSQNTTPPSPSASAGGVITCSSPNVTLTGGGGGSYSWTGPGIVSGAATANPVVNAGGTYNLNVTGGNGCTAGTSVVVSQNTTPPSPTASSGGVITCSSPNVTLTGGGGGSYSWTGPGIVSGAATANPLVNAGGTYNLTVTDGSNGCSAGTSVVVSQNTTPPSPTASSGGVITCSSPNVTLTGGGGGSYSWTGPGIVSGAATANPVVNAGGTYNLTVTGGNGCTAGTSVNVTTNTTPPSPSASAGGVITCSSPNVTLTGGGGGSYSWTGPGIVSGAATANPVVNAGGTYNLTVTGGNGCTAGTSVNVTQSTTLPTASSTAGTTNLNCLTTSTSLNGGATGGSSPYSYSWSPATGLSATNISNPTANPSSTQTYVLTVTDDNGCQSTSNVTINVNTTPPSVTASAGSVKTCSNPNVTLNATGGGSYSWTGTGIVSGATTANPVVNQAGTFNVTVTGSNGCTANSSVNVTQNTTVPSIALSTASTLSTTCASPNVNLSATSNANPATTYTWLTPLSTTLTGNPVNVSATGIYTVFVTNTTNGCNTTTTPITVQVVADANIPVVTLSANSGTLTCSVTSIGVTANTTASPVTYNWLPTTGIVSGANSATPVFNAAGNYSLTVTNTANSCASTGASNVVTIVANNTNPTAGASASSAVLNCTNTSLVLTGTGGGTYSWSGPGIVSGGNTANPTINQVGTYSLVVTNPGNNCVSNNVATVTITQNTTTPSLVLGTASTLSTTCANPTATLTASSSADPSTIYTWLTPISTTLTGSSVNASAAGIYTVFVTDSNNGCVSSFAATGTTVELVPDSNIPVITLSSNTVAITCSNPTPTVSANANVSTATYNWSPTTGIVSGANTNNPTFNAPGSYSLVVTNTANSCVTGNSDYVVTVVSNTTAPVVSLSAGSNTGTITCSNPNVVVSPTINPSSGLTYTWSPTTGLSSNPNQANATFIANGVYQLSVTDVVTGCVSVLDAASSFTVVSNIDTPTISVVPTSSNTILGCGTNATVMYSVAVTSASGNNSYNWQPSGSNSVFTTVSGAGMHSVTVTDNINGCSTSTTFNALTDITIPSITAADSTLFPCDSNATALIASSSNPNVSYAWQGASVLSGANSNVASIGSVGVYTVTVTDNVTNCFSTHTVAVIMDSVVALFSANPNIGVEPLIVTFFNNSVSSNTANTTYSWDFGNASPTSTLTNPSNTFELSGVYSVTLVATLGVCSDSAYTTVIVNEDVTLIIPNFFTPNGDSQNELFFITGIEKYPNNQLEIYNRWGSLVYLKKAYNNTFEGKPNQPSMGNGMLPTGTYFYNLDLGDNTTKPFKGYIELKY